MPVFRGLLAVAMCLSGAACSSLNPFKSTPKPPCPRAEVLRDATRTYLFKPGPGRDLSDLRFEVRLFNADSACSHSDGRVEVELRVTIAARRGPADADRKADVSYFVAVLGPDGRVLNKKVFGVDITFPVNVDKGALTESLRQVIPLGPGESAADYTVLTGLQLTEAELEYNRRQPRGPAAGLDRQPVTPGRTAPEPEVMPYEPKERMKAPGTR